MIKILKKILDILFIIVIVLLASYFILRSRGIIQIYEVETGSMEDGIHPGDYVLICKKDSYKIGDVVTYTKDNYYVTHRIIKEDNNGVITKGDANNTEDEEISRDSIVGKVILIGGILNIIIDYKYAIVSFLLGIYLLSSYFDRKDSDEQNEQEEQKENIKDEEIKEKIETEEVKKDNDLEELTTENEKDNKENLETKEESKEKNKKKKKESK